MLLKQVCLNPNIGRVQCVKWFVVHPLEKYIIILGKDWIEEVPHHVNHKKNRLWLGSDGDGSRFRSTIDGLTKDEGRNSELLTATAEAKTARVHYTLQCNGAAGYGGWGGDGG
jgi:hypothetical protein